MKKEKIKTIILLLLIAGSIFLSVTLWFGDGLWPSGYSFITALKNETFLASIFRRDTPDSIPMDNLAKPQKIVVTNGGNRAVYYNTDASYSLYYTSAKDFLSVVLTNESSYMHTEIVPNEEWYEVLRNDELLDTKSIYVDYSVSFTPKLFAQVTGIKTTWLENAVTSVKEFIIAPVDGSAGESLLYVKDSNNGEIHKYYMNYSGTESLVSAVSSLTENMNYSFAFELNLHNSETGLGTGIVQKVVMEPLTLISSQQTESYVIESSLPDIDTTALASVFDYRTKTLNRYTDSTGTEHFIENYSSLNIYSDGLIEYYAVDAKKGLNLFGENESNKTLYECLNRAISFSEKVWATTMSGVPFDVLITSDLLETSESTYFFTLNYYYDGITVVTDVNDKTHDYLGNAVEIEVQDGRIVKYRHFMRQFEKTGETTTSLPMLTAIDGIYKNFENAENQTIISDMYLAYVETEEAEIKAPVWCVKAVGKDGLIFYRG